MVRDFLNIRISDEWLEILENMRAWIGDMDGADKIWERESSPAAMARQNPPKDSENLSLGEELNAQDDEQRSTLLEHHQDELESPEHELDSYLPNRTKNSPLVLR